jgi:hypothetical protein
MGINVTPIAKLVTAEIDGKVVARYPNCSEGTGRSDYTTKGEEGLSTFDFATGVSGTAGTPLASAA